MTAVEGYQDFDVPLDYFNPQPDHCQLDVGIVGAGIGGLAAAIALAKSSHNITIYERSKFSNEVGAAIVVAPNCSRILDYYGFDFEKAGATVFTEMEFIDGSTLAVNHNIPCDRTAEKYHGKWYALHRSDFHAQLRDHALSYPNVQLCLDAKVEGVDTRGVLTMKNGEVAHKDLIIIADGVKQASSGTLQNFGFFHADDLPFDDEVWDIEATTDDIRKDSQRLNPALQALCEHATQPRQWRLIERNKLIENLTKDNAVLIGDAAHPLLPFQGQGAAMAIEDAAVLGVLISQMSSRAEIPSRLALFQELRKDRVCAMQIFSRQQQDHASMDEAEKYVKGKLPTCPAEYHEFGLQPDVIADAKMLLQEHFVTDVISPCVL
ncbi:uncharacterized protein MYCGRDRAFT_90338 [Zymoseptoria tritici IPO323]|uniref:FAD-binding domain-containing protein n=1 Tax=Zymoseptoria tritici (strain CBS 115943 / IPO323) TaxID=336722 RepID=F9X1Y6_ZYMTI|nr:uncharacterized protein MYCGRDRAFT_90338 [Zymoseptoria tritici IPO323]EGP89678.1 hypothetical protein MYCGRDRAFT_90338 [Zymoseptoria tritici IPO323]